MALGTFVSRGSGFVRAGLLAAALGNQLHADVFNVANTIPNMLYILLAGGVFNAVLVPQLVRAARTDPDGGAAFSNRIITLAAVFLVVVTAVLVQAAPYVVSLYTPEALSSPTLAAQRQSLVDFARYCLPQVFFYGMFVVLSQVLNARGRFGPMMWAPIANNLVSIGVLVVYLLAFGPTSPAHLDDAYSSRQELVLGAGSTVAVAAQFALLLLFVRGAGIRYRPRFDFFDRSLGRTFSLGTWTVLFVLVNQVAYLVVVRLATSGPADAARTGETGSGYTVYSQAFLLATVAHSVITVSIATAIVPRLTAHVAERELATAAGLLATGLRRSLTAIVPLTMLMPVVAADAARIAFGWGAASDDAHLYAVALALFAPGIAFMTVHYLMLRGLYALERNRTAFLIQSAVAAVNVIAALVLVRATDPARTVPALTIAYCLSYLVGSAIAYATVRRALGRLRTRRLLMLLAWLVPSATLAAIAALAASRAIHGLVGQSLPASLLAIVSAAAVAAVVLVVVSRVLGKASDLEELVPSGPVGTRRRPQRG